MVLKLSKEKRETGHLTVHESAEENVTCFLWQPLITSNKETTAQREAAQIKAFASG